MAGNVIQSFVNGANGTIFAYGSTGSGKTFKTMMGNDDFPGIIPLAVEHIFNCLFQNQANVYKVSFSYFEIYNEKIRDLLQPNHNEKQLTSKTATSAQMVFETIQAAEVNRSTGATSMNDHSSRSHAIVRIVLESQPRGERGVIYKSVLNLVDLAGSECQKNTNAEGSRQLEASNINKSLLALSKLIDALQKNKTVVSYRDSLLTYYLRDSIGGCAHTAIICAINSEASQKSTSETTLRFAQKAMKIKNEPKINKCMTKEARIKELEKEVEMLRGIINDKDEQTFENLDTSQFDTTRYITMTQKQRKECLDNNDSFYLLEEKCNRLDDEEIEDEIDKDIGEDYDNIGHALYDDAEIMNKEVDFDNRSNQYNHQNSNDEVDYSSEGSDYSSEGSDDIFSEKIPVLPKKAPKRKKELLISPSKEINAETTIELNNNVSASVSPIVLPKKKKKTNLFSFVPEENDFEITNHKNNQIDKSHEQLNRIENRSSEKIEIKENELKIENEGENFHEKITEYEKVIQDLKEALKEKDEMIYQLQKEHNEMNHQIHQLKNELTTQESIQQDDENEKNKKIEHLKNELVQANEANIILKKENNILIQKVKEFQNSLIEQNSSASISQTSEITQLKEEIESLKNIMTSKDAQIKGNNLNLSSMKTRMEQKDSLLIRLGDQIESQKSEIEKLTKEKETIEKEKEILIQQNKVLRLHNNNNNSNIMVTSSTPNNHENSYNLEKNYNRIQEVSYPTKSLQQQLLAHNIENEKYDLTTKKTKLLTGPEIRNENTNSSNCDVRYAMLKSQIKRRISSENDEDLTKIFSNNTSKLENKGFTNHLESNATVMNVRQPLQAKPARLTNHFELQQAIMQRVQQSGIVDKKNYITSKLMKPKKKLSLENFLSYEASCEVSELDSLPNISSTRKDNNKSTISTQTKVRFEPEQYLQMSMATECLNDSEAEICISTNMESVSLNRESFSFVYFRDNISSFLCLLALLVYFCQFILYSL
ncbi:hypothetical protein TRFO_21471 [Tritrichomonas foetus]|uniref:Kinesin-like protein n=1 Tax=Tritrichomonas foetus TaxID=1144522 RepID=A0A1J4KID3_9EUKA|nr:hypothetical protein TRFO_21471 [Tritrichomonas foetus]|eukprot:OHT09588.1 hypothetical protein TRFO_21471 [Tritrichomonas foetus]